MYVRMYVFNIDEQVHKLLLLNTDDFVYANYVCMRTFQCMYVIICMHACSMCVYVCMQYLFLIIVFYFLFFLQSFTQRQCIVNLFRACVGLAPDDSMLLEHRVPTLIQAQAARKASDAAGLKISILHTYIHAIYLL